MRGRKGSLSRDWILVLHCHARPALGAVSQCNTPLQFIEPTEPILYSWAQRPLPKFADGRTDGRLGEPGQLRANILSMDVTHQSVRAPKFEFGSPDSPDFKSSTLLTRPQDTSRFVNVVSAVSVSLPRCFANTACR